MDDCSLECGFTSILRIFRIWVVMMRLVGWLIGWLVWIRGLGRFRMSALRPERFGFAILSPRVPRADRLVMRMRGNLLTQPSPTEGRGHNVMRQRRIWRPSWSGGDTRRTGQGPAAERDSLRREPAMQCFRLCLTVLSRRRRTVSLNLLMTPMVRKFPVGRWAVYLGFLPDVKYSVGNVRADGQWAGVTCEDRFFHGCTGLWIWMVSCHPAVLRRQA